MNLSEISDRDLHREQRRRRKLRKKRSRKAHGLPKRKKGMGVRIGDRDDALKAARGYTDPSTYVRRDGSEKLVGIDWRKRVDELRERSGGRCEIFKNSWMLITPPLGTCVADAERCSSDASDPHHVTKRSIRRDDRLSNLLHLCREHHIAIDPRKIRSGGGNRGKNSA